jgi:hypothetical protein
MNIWPSEVNHGASSDGQPLRLAILNTPRSGSTWLRKLLDGMYGLSHVVVNTPEQLEWHRIPDRCVLHFHWPAEAEFVRQLERCEFKPLTLLRHPLDVLISILHFTSVSQDTSVWAGGRGGDESLLAYATPCSREFIEYACGSRARHLLSIGPSWQQVPTCYTLRYEEMVSDTTAQMAKLAQWVGAPTCSAIEDAVAKNSLNELRSNTGNQHFWQGRPGLWKSLITSEIAQRIAQECPEYFGAYSGDCVGDTSLDEAQASRNWSSLELSSLKRELSLTRRQVLKQRYELERLRAEFDGFRELVNPLLELGPQSPLVWKVKQIAARVPGVQHLFGRSDSTSRKAA